MYNMYNYIPENYSLLVVSSIVLVFAFNAPFSGNSPIIGIYVSFPIGYCIKCVHASFSSNSPVFRIDIALPCDSPIIRVFISLPSDSSVIRVDVAFYSGVCRVKIPCLDHRRFTHRRDSAFDGLSS